MRNRNLAFPAHYGSTTNRLLQRTSPERAPHGPRPSDLLTVVPSKNAVSDLERSALPLRSDSSKRSSDRGGTRRESRCPTRRDRGRPHLLGNRLDHPLDIAGVVDVVREIEIAAANREFNLGVGGIRRLEGAGLHGCRFQIVTVERVEHRRGQTDRPSSLEIEDEPQGRRRGDDASRRIMNLETSLGEETIGGLRARSRPPPPHRLPASVGPRLQPRQHPCDAVIDESLDRHTELRRVDRGRLLQQPAKDGRAQSAQLIGLV